MLKNPKISTSQGLGWDNKKKSYRTPETNAVLQYFAVLRDSIAGQDIKNMTPLSKCHTVVDYTLRISNQSFVEDLVALSDPEIAKK